MYIVWLYCTLIEHHINSYISTATPVFITVSHAFTYFSYTCTPCELPFINVTSIYNSNTFFHWLDAWNYYCLRFLWLIQNNQGRRLGLIILTESLTSLFWISQKQNLVINYVIIHWTKKMEVMFLLLYWRETTQSAQTWHDRDLECPWHDYCMICSYDVTGTVSEYSLYAFGQSEKS